MNLHSCHWPGCQKVVANRLWACTTHWYMLPKTIRGQMKGNNPSPDVELKAMHWIRNYISQHEAVPDWFCVECDWSGRDEFEQLETFRCCLDCGGYVVSIEALEERAVIIEHDSTPDDGQTLPPDRARAEYLAVASALQTFDGKAIHQPDKAKVRRVLARWWQLTGTQEAAA